MLMSKGWPGSAKTCGQSKRMGRVRQNMDIAQRWTGFAKTCAQSKGWAGFAKTCGQSKRVDRVRRNRWTYEGSPKHEIAKGRTKFAKP
jgi:hypothetical protein